MLKAIANPAYIKDNDEYGGTAASKASKRSNEQTMIQSSKNMAYSTRIHEAATKRMETANSGTAQKDELELK